MSNTSRRALIVIDVQNEYFTGNLKIEYPDSSTSLANICKAMDGAQAAQIPIIVVQQVAPAQSPIFAEGSTGWELHEAIQSRPWQHKIDKKLPNAFAGTNLADWLAENKINTLCVAGYMTHNCVDSTIKHAFHKGLEVEYLQDASGTLSYANQAGFASAEEIHRTFSIVMQARFAAVMDTQEWLQLIQGNGTAVLDSIFQSSRRGKQVQRSKSA
ncbi:MAG: cysteine hydrolase family protein [Gammaproteobacteria bacterium]|jgi:nicotinamidase-related amidase